VIISHYSQGSEAWFEERKARITGIRYNAMMMGENTKGYNDLIADVAGEIITGQIEEKYKSSLMERGTQTEPEARAHLSDVLGEMSEVGFMTLEQEDKFSEWVGLSPDALLVGQRKYIEIKCPLLKTHLGYFRTGKPKEYRWQLQGGLWLMKEDYDSIYFCSYYPNVKPYILEVMPDEKDFKALEERLPITIERIEELLEVYRKSDDYLQGL